MRYRQIARKFVSLSMKECLLKSFEQTNIAMKILYRTFNSRLSSQATTFIKRPALNYPFQKYKTLN